MGVVKTSPEEGHRSAKSTLLLLAVRMLAQHHGLHRGHQQHAQRAPRDVSTPRHLFDEEQVEVAGQFGLVDVEKFEKGCSDRGFEFD